MQQAIADYHLDKENDWVAELQCGHFQHVRHQPPFINRPWVTTACGRDAMRGYLLTCKKCERDEPKDTRV